MDWKIFGCQMLRCEQVEVKVKGVGRGFLRLRGETEAAGVWVLTQMERPM